MSEWVSVKDRLPQIDEPVWIYWRNREVVIGWKTCGHCEPNECWYSFDGGEKCRNTDWWMPINCKPPEPPK